MSAFHPLRTLAAYVRFRPIADISIGCRLPAMKLFLVSPVTAADTDEAAHDARFRECSERIADLIASHVQGDPALFAMREVSEVSEASVVTDARYGDIQTVRVADPAVLRTILRDSGDPNSGKWMLMRSLVTCRAVLYAHDGQAFVCLPSEVAPIVSPDDTLISVAECSHLLAETDWMDGLSVS